MLLSYFTLCVSLPSSHIKTLFSMKCRETCSVFREDRCVRKSGHLRNRVIEQICRQEVTHNVEVGPKGTKKK